MHVSVGMDDRDPGDLAGRLGGAVHHVDAAPEVEDPHQDDQERDEDERELDQGLASRARRVRSG